MSKCHQARIWPVSCWPAADRELWREACAGHGVHGEYNPAFTWSLSSRRTIEAAYGRYIAWLANTKRALHLPPVERIRPDVISAFTEDMQREGLAGASVASYVRSIRAFAGAIAPACDWQWLATRAFRLKARATPSKDKRLRVVNSQLLFDLGCALMDGAGTRLTDVAAASQFQGGLMIALLAARPLRLGNFSRLEFGRTLVHRAPDYWLRFSEQETKTGRPINMPLPNDLHGYVEEFLRGPRKLLLQGGAGTAPTAALWLSTKGQPLHPDQIRAVINMRTKARFGHPVNPHLFRDCLATTLAIDAPADILCAVPILGHTSFRMMEKHYNQATMVTATRKFSSSLMELRNELIGQFDLHDARSFLVALEDRGTDTP